MSKFLIVTEHFLPTVGGGIRYMVALVDYFRKCGHTVDVLTVGKTWRTSYEVGEGGTIIRLGEHLKFDSGRLSASVLPFMLGNLASYDLVHWNAPNPLGELGFAVSRLLGQRPSRSVCFYHGEVVQDKPLSHLYNNWLLSTHFGKCDRLLVSSPNFAQTSPLLEKYQHKIKVIPFGIDTEKYSPAPDWNPEAVFNKDQDTPLRFIFVGRLVEHKGIFLLLEALQQVSGTLDVVGTGPSDLAAREFVSNNGLSERVTFHGEVTQNITSLYRSADVVVLPSTTRSESFGYVLIEGMASGLAAISTELGTGTSFANLHQETGLVISPGQSATLVESMTYLDQHRTELAQMKHKARKRAVDCFTKEIMLDQTKTLFKELGVWD
ncbi:MAG: glycosyltransferase [Microcystaceae cyanobacterium]